MYKYILVLLLILSISVILGAIPSTTDWDSISPVILDSFANSLPIPPASVLEADFSSFPENPFTTFELNKDNMPANNCQKPIPSGYKFPQYGVEYGSNDTYNGNQTCRVEIDGTKINLKNKKFSSNTTPVSANPAWLQFRFPLPLNRDSYGTPQTMTIKFDPINGFTYNLTAYGGNPCKNPKNPPNCTLNIEGQWDRQMKPGYYILWSTPGSTGYIIQGPYNESVELNLPIPTELKAQSIKEIDMVIFAFSTYPYPYECPDVNCYIFVHKSVRVMTVRLNMGVEFTFPKLPDTGHPRIYGNHSTFWSKKVGPFWNLPCDQSAPGGISVHSIRDDFENALFGGSICDTPSTRKTTLATHPIASKYLSGQLSTDLNVRDSEGRNIMYLVRFLRSCYLYSGNVSSCVYTQTELNQLVPKIISGELNLWSNWGVWYDGYVGSQGVFGVDLGTRTPLRFWSLFLDTFYNDLSSTQIKLITDQMDARAVDFVNVFNYQGWALYNGNNWTPYICSAYMYYVITRWYDYPALAETVGKDIMAILYRNRPMYEADGVYVEGLAHYTAMSVDSLIELDYVLYASLGIHSYGINWGYFEKTHKWILDSILSDGFTTDFGDSHITLYSALTPIYSMYIPEIIGYGTANVDPCQLLKYWTIHYFSNGLDQLFDFHNVIARNWSDIVKDCPKLPDSTTSVYQSGGTAFFRRRGRNSGYGKLTSAQHADFSGLAMEAKWNGYSHTESDFGGIIWTAYGARFLYDMSYGTISGNDKTKDIDNNPAGANTLVVEDAWNSTVINLSQFSPVRGSIEKYTLTLDSVSYDVFKLDGSLVYGSNRSDGWLKRFYRYGIALTGSADYIILDTYTQHDRLTSVNVSQYFYSGKMNTWNGQCGMWTTETTMGLFNGEVRINPLCNNILLNKSPPAARIVGAGIAGNPSFSYDGDIYYAGAPFNHRYRSKFNGGYVSVPDARAFLLVASDNATSFPSYSIAKQSSVNCIAGKTCFEATRGNITVRLELVLEADGYKLDCIRTLIGGSYSNTACSQVGGTTTASYTTNPATTTGSGNSFTDTTTIGTSSSISSTGQHPLDPSISNKLIPNLSLLLLVIIVVMFY